MAGELYSLGWDDGALIREVLITAIMISLRYSTE